MATAEANIQNKIRKGKKTSEENLEGYVEILDETVNAESKNSKAEQIKLSSEEDLESLLKLAEGLKEKIDKNFRGNLIGTLRWLQLFALFALAASLISQGFSEISLSSIPLGRQFLIFIYFFALFIAEVEIRRIKRELAPDKFALKEVLQLLREVHGTIAEREDWSILKRAEFRIRLSRFDLSEKKDSVFSFFS